MTDVRVSDADRERAVGLLRDHAAEGRLTLEEFTERMSAAYLAQTDDELAMLTRDLPARTGAVPARRPTRLLLSIFGSAERDGRIALRNRALCLTFFGNVDLDLRQATLERGTLTVYALGAFGAIDVYAPESVDVDLHGFALLGHARAHGTDTVPPSGAPVVRVVALSLVAGIDVWRVPAAWKQKPWRDVIRGIRKGDRPELTA